MDERIVRESTVCSGAPVVRGTRILVNNIVGMLAGGYSEAQILEAYPDLTPDDILAAIDYERRHT